MNAKRGRLGLSHDVDDHGDPTATTEIVADSPDLQGTTLSWTNGVEAKTATLR